MPALEEASASVGPAATASPPDLAALCSKVPAERLAALRQIDPASVGFPEAAADLRFDKDPKIRAEVLRLAAKAGHGQALDWLKAGFNDNDVLVRIAAIESLGSIASAEAKNLRQTWRADSHEALRAAAVKASAAAGEQRDVLAAVNDRAWRVRLAAAEGMAGFPSLDHSPQAAKLLSDASPEVSRRFVASLRAWPLELAAPLLVAAIESPSLVVRRAAAADLAERWPPAKQFDPQAPIEQRAAQVEKLRQELGNLPPTVAAAPELGRTAEPAARLTAESLAEFHRAVESLDRPGATDAECAAAIGQLRALGVAALAAAEQHRLVDKRPLTDRFWAEVAAPLDPSIAAIERLRSAEVTQQRRAAESLVENATRRPLGRLAQARLLEVMSKQADAIVWEQVLDSLRTAVDEEAIRLNYLAAAHTSPEVRRRACGNLAAHGSPRHAAVLVALLDDPARSVVSAAIEALGRCGPLDDTSPLRAKMATASESQRVELATALGRLGDPTGKLALERLAHSRDSNIRRHVATSLGELHDAEVVPTLIGLLDDQAGIRREALASLTRTVDKNIGVGSDNPPPDTDRQVQRWKAWFAQQNRSDGRWRNAEVARQTSAAGNAARPSEEKPAPASP